MFQELTRVVPRGPLLAAAIAKRAATTLKLRDPDSSAPPHPGGPSVANGSDVAPLIAILAFLMGSVLGLLGGGGSILTLPIFVYIAGLPAHDAIAASLVVVGATAAVNAGCSGKKAQPAARRRQDA